MDRFLSASDLTCELAHFDILLDALQSRLECTKEEKQRIELPHYNLQSPQARRSVRREARECPRFPSGDRRARILSRLCNRPSMIWTVIRITAWRHRRFRGSGFLADRPAKQRVALSPPYKLRRGFPTGTRIRTGKGTTSLALSTAYPVTRLVAA